MSLGQKMEEQVDSSTIPQHGHSGQHVIRCGWLRKQGGFVKTWHTRWFVLKGDQLYYYKDEDETKALVSTYLIIFHFLFVFFLRVFIYKVPHFLCCEFYDCNDCYFEFL